MAYPRSGESWDERAALAHEVLLTRYQKSRWPGLFQLADPAREVDRWRVGYWWQAHALDALVDAHLRAPSPDGPRRMRAVPRGIRLAGRSRLGNDYYDDMAWMALALLRADEAGAGTAGGAVALWRQIQAGWNAHHGGGIAWSKKQPDYKNVPANGPAAILAARLHRRYGDPADLEWAQRITDWIDATLVDPNTHQVWDGVGRRGDDHVDRDWLFTYTHGVLIGAHTELHALTGDPRHSRRIAETVDAVVESLAPDGVLQDEGPGDGALFRGILARYLAPVDDRRSRALLLRSAEAAWAARDSTGRFGPSWREPPPAGSQLSAHLSGLLLVEQLAVLERT